MRTPIPVTTPRTASPSMTMSETVCCSSASRGARSSTPRMCRRYSARSICARVARTAGPLRALRVRKWIPQWSAPTAIAPPSASISLTRCPLPIPPMAGIAAHLAEGFNALREQQRLGAGTGRGERRLGAGVAAPDDDDVECSVVEHGDGQAGSKLCDGVRSGIVAGFVPGASSAPFPSTLRGRLRIGGSRFHEKRSATLPPPRVAGIEIETGFRNGQAAPPGVKAARSPGPDRSSPSPQAR